MCNGLVINDKLQVKSVKTPPTPKIFFLPTCDLVVMLVAGGWICDDTLGLEVLELPMLVSMSRVRSGGPTVSSSRSKFNFHFIKMFNV